MIEQKSSKNNDNDLPFELLEKSKILAENANQIKSESLSNISHDLRNPLTSIIGFANLLLDGNFGNLMPEQKEVLEFILQSGQYALSLTNQMLNISKIQYQKVNLHLTKFDLQEVVIFLIKMHENQSKQKQIPIKSSFSKDCGMMIYTDREKLIEILGNLLQNALKYTNEGSVGIQIEKRENFYEICVWDTGIGIQEEDFYFLFQPYSRLKSSETHTKEGTGIGLYHTKQLVDLLKGNIFVESLPHKGSKFIVSIPETFISPESIQNSKIGAFFFGLNQAGKTSIINYFQNIPTKTYKPTFALVITRIKGENSFYELIDCPGQEKLRQTWENGLNLAKLLIFVLDISEPNMFSLAYSEFRRILSLKITIGMPVLILFHKIDLNVSVSNIKLAEKLFNPPINGHRFYFFNTSIKIPESMNNLQKFIEKLIL